jgi:acyl-CoA thioesterase-2
MDWLLPVRAVSEDGLSFEVVPYSELLGTYGSFLMACAVRSASGTVEGMALTSLNAQFLASPKAGPIRFDVEATRSGRSVAVRRVVVGQERPCAVMALSFAAPTPDGAQWDPEPIPPGEGPESFEKFEERATGRPLLDLRPIGGCVAKGYQRRHPYWARPVEPFGDGGEAAAAAIALASDQFVTALATPSEEGPPVLSVTLDHSLWIHRETHADDWLRFDAALVAVHDGRAMIRGSVSDVGGRLVASFVQQAMRRGR